MGEVRPYFVHLRKGLQQSDFEQRNALVRLGHAQTSGDFHGEKQKSLIWPDINGDEVQPAAPTQFSGELREGVGWQGNRLRVHGLRP